MLPIDFVETFVWPWVLFLVAPILPCRLLARLKSDGMGNVVGDSVSPNYYHYMLFGQQLSRPIEGTLHHCQHHCMFG